LISCAVFRRRSREPRKHDAQETNDLRYSFRVQADTPICVAAEFSLSRFAFTSVFLDEFVNRVSRLCPPVFMRALTIHEELFASAVVQG